VSLYPISLFLHIVGALTLFAALGLEWAGLYNLRRATETGQVREWLRLLGAPRFLGGPAALAILATGIYLTATRWGPQGWIIVSLVGMVLIAVLGAALSGRRIGAIARALPAEQGSISPAFARQLRDPGLTLSLRLRTALFLGIVYLMSTRPSTGGALMGLAVAAGVGLALSIPARGSARGRARIAESRR
jgi:hypothetical protein